MPRKLLLVAVLADWTVLIAELRERPNQPPDYFFSVLGVGGAAVWSAKPENYWFEYRLVRQCVHDYIRQSVP